jgi:hypothetical protein
VRDIAAPHAGPRTVKEETTREIQPPFQFPSRALDFASSRIGAGNLPAIDGRFIPPAPNLAAADTDGSIPSASSFLASAVANPSAGLVQNLFVAPWLNTATGTAAQAPPPQGSVGPGSYAPDLPEKVTARYKSKYFYL